MAAGESPPVGDVFIALQQGRDDAEKASPGAEDDEDLDKTLSIERFGDLISKSASSNLEKQSRSYSERDFECIATAQPTQQRRSARGARHLLDQSLRPLQLLPQAEISTLNQFFFHVAQRNIQI